MTEPYIWFDPSEAIRQPDGRILLWDNGKHEPVSRLHALFIASALQDSPIPASRARSIAIRRACIETVSDNT